MSSTKVETQSVQVVNDQPLEQWQIDLERDGYAVVKGAVPREHAEACGDAMLTWLENLQVIPASW